MSGRQEPLTPRDCDLRDFPFMQIEIKRLLTSETWMLGTGTERSASIALWLESWHQVPAGSLPNKDAILAHLSQHGMEWASIKDNVLKGWVECSDGRLYHPVVCEKALEAMLERLSYRLSSGKGNAVRYKSFFDPGPIVARVNEVNRLLLDVNPDSKKVMQINADKLAVVNPQANPDPQPKGRPEKKTSKVSAPESVRESGGDPKGEGEGEREGYIGGVPPITPCASAADPEQATHPDSGQHGMETEQTQAVDGRKQGASVPGQEFDGEVAGGKVKPLMVGLVVPDWVPADEFAAFVDMRKKMGRSIPFTLAAAEGIIRKLDKLRKTGQVPADMLEQSVRQGWRDVFEVKVQFAGRGQSTQADGKYAAAGRSIYGDTSASARGAVDSEVIDV